MHRETEEKHNDQEQMQEQEQKPAKIMQVHRSFYMGGIFLSAAALLYTG